VPENRRVDLARDDVHDAHAQRRHLDAQRIHEMHQRRFTRIIHGAIDMRRDTRDTADIEDQALGRDDLSVEVMHHGDCAEEVDVEELLGVRDGGVDGWHRVHDSGVVDEDVKAAFCEEGDFFGEGLDHFFVGYVEVMDGDGGVGFEVLAELAGEDGRDDMVAYGGDEYGVEGV
jgi:hypothetical protein